MGAAEGTPNNHYHKYDDYFVTILVLEVSKKIELPPPPFVSGSTEVLIINLDDRSVLKETVLSEHCIIATSLRRCYHKDSHRMQVYARLFRHARLEPLYKIRSMRGQGTQRCGLAVCSGILRHPSRVRAD